MQAIHDIPELCAQLGVKHAVLSPGSRCAPLTISFAQHLEIKEISISDERSAGFIALGIAQSTQTPVVLICTSGSALLNYAPAISEAYFSQTPLVVLSADRPPEWIGQQDGQAIHQQDVFGKHVKTSYQLPVDSSNNDSAWEIKRKVCEAINISLEGKKGPVHLNIPFREPFYPKTSINFSDIKAIRSIAADSSLNKQQFQDLEKELASFTKIIIIAGQGNHPADLATSISKWNVPVITETISNYPDSYCTLSQVDHIFLEETELLPQLIISFGQSVLSKSLKNRLRTQNIEHWHIQNYTGVAPDTFQHLTKVIHCKEVDFFKSIHHKGSPNYIDELCKLNNSLVQRSKEIIKAQEFSEFQALCSVTDSLPVKSNLHLANSMAVRYSNLYPPKNLVKVFANRGTSGIDGSSSTCVGVSLVDQKINTLFTGDLSFFYDSNAFWNNYISDNLRIVVFNNQGGGIFRMINGPASQKELEPYFVTKQQLKAKALAELYNLEYLAVENSNELTFSLKTFFKAGKSKILEIFTDGGTNTKLFKAYKQKIKETLN